MSHDVGVVRAHLGRWRKSARMRREFEQRKHEHLKFCSVVPAKAPDPTVLAELNADGVSVVRGFFDRDTTESIVDEVIDAANALVAGHYDGPLRTLAEHETGLYRIYDIDKSMSFSSRQFFDNAFIAQLANSMCVPGMHVFDHYLDYKAQVGGRDANLVHHIDHWKTRFKAFLLLSDVTEEQAPFVFLSGSHREARWRRRWDWGYETRGPEGAVLSGEHVRSLHRRYRFVERTITGTAGDLILANTRGIHRGNVLQRGTRLQLVSVYVMNGPPTYAS